MDPTPNVLYRPDGSEGAPLSTREKIVDAAMAVVREQGVGKLTLDEAARVAGVSKGGVLYHFRAKDELIAAMVARLIDQCEALQHRYYAELPERPYRWAKANVLAALDPCGPTNDPVGGALLAAVAVNPALVQPLKVKQREWADKLCSDAPDPQLALLVALAMDGLWLHDMVGLRLLDEDGRERLRRRAFALLGEEE